MSGFTLKEIEADKIVMLRGEEKIVVSISDPAHPKVRNEADVMTASSSQQPQQQPPVSSARRGGQVAPKSGTTTSTTTTQTPFVRPDVKAPQGSSQSRRYTPSKWGGGGLLFPKR
jgi:hypothetical protein